jgi:hypothetical protein
VTTKTLLPILLPKAIDWCRVTSQAAATGGASLTANAREDARTVGVEHPERIRVLVLDELPMPDDSILATAAASLGFLGPTTAGLALGYSILVRRGRLSRRLLSHEFRHVVQFEAAGSLSAFITKYLEELVEAGYEESSFEVDARAHELPNADLRWRPLE